MIGGGYALKIQWTCMQWNYFELIFSTKCLILIRLNAKEGLFSPWDSLMVHGMRLDRVTWNSQRLILCAKIDLNQSKIYFLPKYQQIHNKACFFIATKLWLALSSCALLKHPRLDSTNQPLSVESVHRERNALRLGRWVYFHIWNKSLNANVLVFSYLDMCI